MLRASSGSVLPSNRCVACELFARSRLGRLESRDGSARAVLKLDELDCPMDCATRHAHHVPRMVFDPCRSRLVAFPSNTRDSTGSSPKSRQSRQRWESSGVKPRAWDAPHATRQFGAAMSSYPPPPSSTTDGTAPTPDTPQQGAEADSHQAHSQTHPQFAADAAAAAAAVAAAHHGLQALQAAVAAPAQPVPSPSPVTLQTHVSLAEASYLAATDAGPPSASGANSKATRLRRACDMCSQRKVKVRALAKPNLTSPDSS
jgi:hypothetical protein